MARMLLTFTATTTSEHLLLPASSVSGPAGNTVTYHALRRFRSTRKPIQKYLFLRDLQLFNPRWGRLLLLYYAACHMHACAAACMAPAAAAAAVLQQPMLAASHDAIHLSIALC
jgi:hypothetical protein